MLVGSRVILRALEPADYELIWRWTNDPSVMVFWGHPGNSESRADVQAREDRERLRGNSRKYMVETKDGKAIGQIDYYDLDWQARSAWVSILIGDPDYWGGGYGTDAMRTLLGFLFDELGVHRVVLTTHASNERAIRSYEKNGFQREGVLRDWAYFDGRWVDGILMSVLDGDFRALPAPTQTSPIDRKSV
jgi:RimJ/RimL family protein N-acetyltransferase